MAKETLFLSKSLFGDNWFLKDASGFTIAQFSGEKFARKEVEKFALDGGYRVRIEKGKTFEWFN